MNRTAPDPRVATLTEELSAARGQGRRTGRLLGAIEFALYWLDQGDAETAKRTLRDAMKLAEVE